MLRVRPGSGLWQGRGVDLNRLRFAWTQLGPKPGARAALDRLLGCDDLPGAGWTVIDQRTWRTGVGGQAPWQSRARAAKCVTAWRSFKQSDTGRHLWVQATALAHAEDCPDALAGLLDKAVTNSRFTGEVLGQLEVAVPEVGMHASGMEQKIRTPTGPATNLMVTSDAGANIMIMAASGPDSNMWVWPELLTLAATQAGRLS